ncbi:MAG: O-antigen ligase family protein [Lactobacillales bacterium]|nr:O-antigen ligase family protein [Lactobacillales bacterium]
MANYFFIRQNVTERKHILQFLKGIFLFLGIAIFVGFLQEIYIKTGCFAQPASFIGKFLESHWSSPRFYEQGSYVQTTNRINGLSQEASVFASQIGIIGFPVILTLFKNKFQLFSKLKNKNIIIYLGLFLLMTALCILIKSTSGLIMIVLAWGILFLIIFNSRNKKIQLAIFSGLMFLLAVLTFIYFVNSDIHNFLNEYLIQKMQSESGKNRTAITLGLFKIFLYHPLFGVGYSGPHLFAATIGHVNDNPEMLSFFLTAPYLPQMSELGQYLANYGLITVSPVIYYFGKIKWNFLKLKRNSATQDKLIPVLNDMMFYFLLFFIIGQISVIRTVNSCYLFLLFLFPAAYEILRKKQQI